MFNTKPMHHAGQDGELSIFREEPAPAVLDRENGAARREFAKVRATLPTDPYAHPMSGRVGDY